MKGTEIINDAKDRLKDFIIYELGLLYSAMGWEKDGFDDMVYEFNNNVTMEVWVTDTEGNDYTETRNIERLIVGDDSMFVELEDDREYYLSELSADLLAEIANLIERDYKVAIGKEKFA